MPQAHFPLPAGVCNVFTKIRCSPVGGVHPHRYRCQISRLAKPFHCGQRAHSDKDQIGVSRLQGQRLPRQTLSFRRVIRPHFNVDQSTQSVMVTGMRRQHFREVTPRLGIAPFPGKQRAVERDGVAVGGLHGEMFFEQLQRFGPVKLVHRPGAANNVAGLDCTSQDHAGRQNVRQERRGPSRRIVTPDSGGAP